MNDFQVVVIGAGPSGSSAASIMAEDGHTVLVVDKRKNIGFPVQCAEFIQRAGYDGPDSCIIQLIDSMITHLSDGSDNKVNSPGYIIDRQRFDNHLAKYAMDRGAVYRLNTIATYEDSRVRLGSSSMVCDFVIDASGPSKKSALAKSLQYTVELSRTMEDIHVFPFNDYLGGYAWIFPRGREANVGLATPGHIDLKGELESFIKKRAGEFGLGYKPSRITGGFIPVSGPRDFVDGNLVRVGDAAGVTHPISGEGNYRAISSGRMAGKAVAQALNDGDISALSKYSESWEAIFGPSMRRDVEKRKQWDTLSLNGGPDPQSLKGIWIGFPQYYSGV